MSDTVRGIIFVVLVVAITFAWLHFFQPPAPPPQKTGQPASQTSTAQTAGAVPGQSGATQAAGAAAALPARNVVVEASAEKTIVVESSLYRVELSNRGGVVRSWKLKKYLDDQKPPHPLDLVNANASSQLGWPLSLTLSDAQLQEQANAGLYDVTPAAGDLTAPAEVAFHWSDGHLDVTKKLKFAEDYQVSIEVSATLDGKPIAPALAWRGGFGDKAVYKASQLVNVFYKQGDSMNLLQYKKLGVSGNQSQPAQLAGPLAFTGIEDQFFAAAFIPEGTDLSLWHWTQYHNVTIDNQTSSEPEAEMAAGAARPETLKVRMYVGPKDLVLLGKVQPSLEQLVQFGWFGIIAKPLLFVLQWTHRYVPNYGWSIVVFTLALTMLLLPIRVWTFRSARKMQSVAPEIKSIQDRYKKYSMRDPRKKKMNEEVMAVYSREGINPVGSCLPMLVQIPILIGFYRTLSGAIELRHAPFILWIHDLSAKDPYYVLPIAMAITTYLMTKMTPTPATVDPAQQKMMMLMPLMLGFIFFNLSSGLNLYYFTSNVVGVAQQWYLNRAQPLPSRSKFKKKKE
ncbi:MAG TPA: membrane protein insertase YidC [Candidatus Acidoferrales bacterium]|nr:membrane protein insertase YidC [Candidatus Acidoferrales bacterium]